jgi:hypothetical protein
VEERASVGAAVEGVRTQLLGQVSEVRASVTRVETKIDTASAAAGEASRKVDQVLTKLDTMTVSPVYEASPKSTRPVPANAARRKVRPAALNVKPAATGSIAAWVAKIGG